MAPNFPSSIPGRENDCCEIRVTLDHLGDLGRALDQRDLPSHVRRGPHEHLHKAQAANPKMELCNMVYLWMLEPPKRNAVVARDALDGIEPDYKDLVEIYTGRKSNQLFLTNQAYLAKFKRHLDQDIHTKGSHHVKVSHHIAKCDAKRLYEAGKGVTGAVDESAILEKFSKRSIPQLGLTFANYKHIYRHNFTKAPRKESCGEFGDSVRVVVQCMNDPPKYHSKMLHESTKGPETNMSVLSRLMLRGVEPGMEEIRRAFFNKYGMKLQDAICKNIPAGDYREFLVAIIESPTC